MSLTRFFSAPADQSSVALELARKRRGQPSERELVFDPKTGELVVAPQGARNPDATTVDQIAEDGFFQVRR